MYKKHQIHNVDLIKELTKELEEVKKKISLLRKKGADTKTLEYNIMNIPSKILMASITNKKIDVESIRNVFQNILAEMDFLDKHYLDEQKKILYMDQLLEKANDLLKKKQFKECLPLYYEIRNFYKELSIESKYVLFDRCIKFYTDFQFGVK